MKELNDKIQDQIKIVGEKEEPRTIVFDPRQMHPGHTLFQIELATGSEWNREESLSHYANIIYGWLLRSNRKWWQHPRWHIHHWSIQFHPLQNFKRRYWDKCCKCGRRGFKSSAYSDWNGTKLWHPECDQAEKIANTINELNP